MVTGKFSRKKGAVSLERVACLVEQRGMGCLWSLGLSNARASSGLLSD